MPDDVPLAPLGSADVARFEVVILGAGQAGLAVAYFLKRAGLEPGRDFLVVDAGPRTGGAWQHRWDSLRLGDAHKVHDLPGMSEMGLSFDHAPRDRPARDVVSAYYDLYEQHFDLRVLRPARAVSVERDVTGFIIAFDEGAPLRRIATRVLVNATGTWTNPRIPSIPGRESFGGTQISTPEWTDASQFAGQSVIVVGGGTSAIGFLSDLADVGAYTSWFTRREPIFVDEEPWLSEVRGARAVSLQDDAARDGRILPSIVAVTGLLRSPNVDRLNDMGRLERFPMFRRVVPEGVIRDDEVLHYADAIVWATGFRADLSHLAPLGVTGLGGAVAVDHGQVESEPRLFLAGYGPQASTVSSNRAARVTARLIAEELAKDVPAT